VIPAQSIYTNLAGVRAASNVVHWNSQAMSKHATINNKRAFLDECKEVLEGAEVGNNDRTTHCTAI
jgi:hypothetical protein